MTSEPAYLFVYGTLRRDAGHPSHGLLAQGAQLIGLARMTGRLYEVADYPGAVFSAGEGEQVVGELYRLLEPEVVLPALDDYEEAGEVYPQPREYRREWTTVEMENGIKVEAWCYLYNRPTAGLRRIPGGDWCGESQKDG